MRLASRRGLLAWGVLGAVAAALFAGASQAGAQDNPPPAPVQADPQNGALLYAQQCAQCHGSSGGGGAMVEYPGQAPALRYDLNPDVTAAYIDLVMSTGRMPPAGSPWDNRVRDIVLDEQQRADVVAWLQQEFKSPGEALQAGEGDIAHGQDVWNTNCAHCHGAAGDGGVAGAGAWTPSVNDKSARVIAESIRVGPFQMPVFTDRQISDEEIGDVVAYMNEVDQEPGTPIFGLVELNPVYASGFVALLAAALLASLVWIGGKPRWLPDPQPQADAADVPAGARRRAPAPRPPVGEVES